MVGVLSVSGARISYDCSEVVDAMVRLGINGDVTRNISVLEGDIEKGCRVRVAQKDAKESTRKLWNELRRTTGIVCAHVHVSSVEDGCVHDVYRPSSCPGPQTSGAHTDTDEV